MSYLNPLRLHFHGTFVAAPSTVNNDPTNYNNATFKPGDQERSKGSWNPAGDASWRFMGCSITSAYDATGTAAAPGDPVLTCLIADSDRQAPAKLVDLDSEQQLVSQIWGLEVRITSAAGDTLMRGRYQVAPFIDLWMRWQDPPPEYSTAGAMYQSVLTDLEWGDVDKLPVLSDLRAAAGSGLLSIKFNVDKYNKYPFSPTFTQGRIAGTIGPALADEPCHLVLGRQFMPFAKTPSPVLVPRGGINSCVAVVDEGRGKILLDLGNALPLAADGGFADLGALTLACQVAGGQGEPEGLLPLAQVDYRQKGWYEACAGVVELPADRVLTAEELAAVAENPLALVLPGPAGLPEVAVSEPPSGLFVRADQFVFRLDSGENAVVRVYATRFGKPLADAAVQAAFDISGLQGGDPPVGVPPEALSFPVEVTTDARGVAELSLRAGNPGNPRGYIDGQVYGVRPLPQAVEGDAAYPVTPSHFISVLVWDPFDAGDPPTWHGGLQPVFQQFANLYPVMARFLDLGDYASVCANRDLLLLAFGHDPQDPNYMPVTRELSMAKRAVILRWLREVGPDGNPLLGTPRPGTLRSAAPPASEGIPASSALAGGENIPAEAFVDGKTAAAARAIGLKG